ncbi:hypothetical protein HK405_003985 [Cladochytrium tenue]|nr:hypothetical protein HK405_003985 [Cladochytrium tenue]
MPRDGAGFSGGAAITDGAEAPSGADSRPRPRRHAAQDRKRDAGLLNHDRHLPARVADLLARYVQAHPDVGDIPFLRRLTKGSGGNATEPLPASPYDRYEETEPMIVVGESRAGYGLCLGRGGWLVSVPCVLQGEEVVARVYWNGKDGVSLGDLVEVRRVSPRRVEPTCKHFDLCNGCSFQHISYEEELKAKHDGLCDVFSARARVRAMFGDKDLSVDQVVPSPMPYGFRTKLSPHFTKTFAGQEFKGLGFNERGRSRKVVDIENCPVATDAVNRLLDDARRSMAGVSDQPRGAGTLLLRHTLVPATREGRLQLIESLGSGDVRIRAGKGKLALPALLAKLKQSRQATSSLQRDDSFPSEFVDEPAAEVTVTPLARRLGLDPDGEPWPQKWPPEGWTNAAVSTRSAVVTDVVNGQLFRGDANLFFQSNGSALGLLAHHVRTQLRGLAAQRYGCDTLVDAYCGTGLFSLQCAADFARVVGVEVDGAAIRWARRNAADNGVRNARFVVGDAADMLDRRALGLPDAAAGELAVVVDPSERGCGRAFLAQLLRLSPKVFVYVSCNPASQAADLDMLAAMAQAGLPPPPTATSGAGSLSPPAPERARRSLSQPQPQQHLYVGGKKLGVAGDELSLVASVESPAYEMDRLGLPVIPVKGYRIESVRPFDMFPHTAKLEVVVTLVRDD